MRLSAFASVKLTIALLTLIAGSILVGAWCPQESQVGFAKVVETFGEPMANTLKQWGITDLFHTPLFLLLIALITVNMIACSVQRVFPKAKLYRQKMPFLTEREISKLAVTKEVALSCPAEEAVKAFSKALKSQGYKVNADGNHRFTAEWARFAILAATITHIGLLSLLAGVTITSWTGFNGFKPVPLDGSLSFKDSEHSKLWIGKLPEWQVRVDDTRREDYESGDAKQWYSNLTVLDKNGKVLKKQEISVNNPLSYDGVDIYQSSWGLDSIRIAFNSKNLELPLRQMGNANAAFMPLDDSTIMIFSLRGQAKPLRVFAKIPEWKEPKMLAEIPQGHEAALGQVKLAYIKPIPVTGLQYKCDPGLLITYTAFGIIMLGVMLAGFPHRQVWVQAVEIDERNCKLYFGGVSRKAKTAFASGLEKQAKKLKEKFGEFIIPIDEKNESNSESMKDNDLHISAGKSGQAG